MNRNTATLDHILSRLRAYRFRNKLYDLFTGLALFIALMVPASYLLLLLESVWPLSVPFRVSAVLFWGVLLIFSFARWLAFPLYRLLFTPDSPELNRVALEVGSKFEGLNDRLANALQLVQQGLNHPDQYSPELVEASIENAQDQVKQEKFVDRIDTRSLRASAKKVFLVVAVFSLFAIAMRSDFSKSFERLTHPTFDYEFDPLFTIQVAPGDTTILKGKTLDIKAWASKSLGEIELDLSENDVSEKVLIPSFDDTFRYSFDNIRNSIQYRFIAGRYQSEQHLIKVVEPPIVRSLKVKITPPAYTGENSYSLEENMGDIQALMGSKIEIFTEMNKELSHAWLRFDDDSRLKLEKAGRRYTTNFKISKDQHYHFTLQDTMGYENANPITYHISVIEDQNPFVRILVPGRDVELPENMTLPLRVLAQDDYGVSKLVLAYQLVPGGETKIDSNGFAEQTLAGISESEQIDHRFSWDLSTLDLFPKDAVVYYIKAFDNDNIRGPKFARSEIYWARFPSLYEMYEELSLQQESVSDQVQSVYQKTKELQKTIDDLSLEMKRQERKPMDWQKRQEIEEVAKKKQDMQKSLKEVSKDLDKMIKSMEKDELVSAETLEKYRQLQELTQEILTPELEKAMQELSESIKNMDENLIQKALESIKQDETSFQRKLDRTIELLRRLKAEQKLDQAIKLAQDVKDREEKLANALKEQSRDIEELAKEQEGIKEQTESFQKTLEELSKELEPFSAEAKDKVSETRNQLQQQKITEQMDHVSQQMQQDSQKAAQSSQQIAQQMQQMVEQLQKAKSDMTGKSAQKTMMALKKSAHDMVELSKQQENLARTTAEQSSNSPQLPDIIEQQSQLQSGLQRSLGQLFEASKQSLAIQPEIAQQILKAQQNMQKAQQSMTDRNTSRASQEQAQAMGHLNQAAWKISQNLNQMGQQSGSGGMSFEQFMQQMQQMAQSQQGINKQSLGMGIGQHLAQQAAMSRLTQRQGQVRKTMQQLAKEAKGMRNVLGDLDHIVEEMKKNEKDFTQNEITPETIERQNRIMSRMLDAQKSIRERETSRQRQGETAKPVFATSPEELPENLNQQNQLQRDLLRAKREGYTRDYFELIKSYFESMQKENHAN